MTTYEPPTVWVVQDNDYTLTSAQEFGVIRFITDDDFQTPGDRHEHTVQKDIRRFVSEYRWGTDYVLLVGNPMVIGYVMAELAQTYRGGVPHQFLKWDKKVHKYLEYPLGF